MTAARRIARNVGFQIVGDAATVDPTTSTGLLWFGFVNHTSSERTVRRIVQQVASIALLVTTGMILVGGVLAVYQLRSR